MESIEKLSTPAASTTTTPTNLTAKMELAHTVFDNVLGNMVGVKIPHTDVSNTNRKVNPNNIEGDNGNSSIPDMNNENTKPTLSTVEEY